MTLKSRDWDWWLFALYCFCCWFFGWIMGLMGLPGIFTLVTAAVTGYCAGEFEWFEKNAGNNDY